MEITERIKNKASQILYKKVGRKYVPVNDPYAYDGLREGWWLVGVKAGCTSIRQQVWPDRSAITAAARDIEDQLTKIISDASAARPKDLPLSADQKTDWEWFIAKHGKSFSTLEYPSHQDNAQKIINVLLNKVK